MKHCKILVLVWVSTFLGFFIQILPNIYIYIYIYIYFPKCYNIKSISSDIIFALFGAFFIGHILRKNMFSVLPNYMMFLKKKKSIIGHVVVPSQPYCRISKLSHSCTTHVTHCTFHLFFKNDWRVLRQFFFYFINLKRNKC